MTALVIAVVAVALSIQVGALMVHDATRKVVGELGGLALAYRLTMLIGSLVMIVLALVKA